MQRRDRRLRTAVLARRQCLASLSRPQRRVLELRAGIGAAAPRTRGAVARRLHTSVRRVARLERAGLRRLRAACGKPAADSVATTTTFAEAALVTPPPSGAAALRRTSTRPASSGKSRGADKPSPSSPPSSRGGVAGEAAVHVPSAAPASGAGILVPLFLVLLAAAGFGVGRLTRGPAPEPAAGPPPPPAERKPSWSESAEASAPGGGDWASPPSRSGGEAPKPAPQPPSAEDPPKLPTHRSPTRRH